VAQYLHNAWGYLLEVTRPATEILRCGRHIADINPLRYRGYFFCLSTGFYYLQTRYYCLFIGRFINADEYVSTGQGHLGFNMFAYCLNNPVNLIDPDGRMAVHGTGGKAVWTSEEEWLASQAAGTSVMGQIQITTPTWPPPRVRQQPVVQGGRGCIVPIISDPLRTRENSDDMWFCPPRKCCWVTVGDGIFTTVNATASIGAYPAGHYFASLAKPALAGAIPMGVTGALLTIYALVGGMWNASRQNDGRPRCCNER